MKQIKLMLFYTLVTFQMTVIASGNGGAYGGAAGTTVNVIQTSESQMLSNSQILTAMLTCGGDRSENNIFKKVLGPLYPSSSNKKNPRNVEISKKITVGLQVDDNSFKWGFRANILNTSDSKDSEKGALYFNIYSSGDLKTIELTYTGGAENNCLPYPTDRCVTSRYLLASNLPIIKFQEVKDIPTVDPITGDILKTELHFKGVTVEYDDSLSPESILYNASSNKTTLLRFPAKELAECLRARLSNL